MERSDRSKRSRVRVALVVVALLAAAPAAAQVPTGEAAARVREALDAMGGEARWRALASIRVEGVGHEHALEQSERPEGPWLPTYRQFSELRDLDDGRLRRHQEQRGFWHPEWSPHAMIADREAASFARGERSGPARPAQHADALARLDLSPERILLTALEAPDLATAGDTTLQGVRHDVVTFTWDDRPVRVFLNAHTRLPAGWSAPDRRGGAFTQMWGDTPTVTVWSLWSLEPGGWLYPRQQDVFRFGHTLERELLSSVAFDVPAPADSFAIAPETREAFAALVAPGGQPLSGLRPGVSFQGEPEEGVTLAEGVVTIPGVYATTFVEQGDGLVILDAPMTDAWTEAVLELAAERFPGVPVVSVVTTSDAWLHVGGVREYVARGVPLHALDLNAPLLERMIAAPRVRFPDSLAKAPRPADIRPVSGPVTIGEGSNRLELYPVRGEGGERMMVAYLPERRILYASDLVQIQPDGSVFWPEYLIEVRNVVARHGLDPETVFAMHTPPRPWAEVTALLAEVEGEAPPVGR